MKILFFTGFSGFTQRTNNIAYLIKEKYPNFLISKLVYGKKNFQFLLKQTKVSYAPLFLKFWEKVANKVSKGTAEKNYMKLEDKWIEKPEELADMYNKYYKSVEDKQFAKQPAFWLSAKKYEDEQPKAISTEKVDMYPFRLKQFKECVETETVKGYVVSTARHHTGDVQRAIAEGEFTKEQAEKYLDLRGWL